ncbi:hydrogenase maturation protease [Clostridium sp. NSJ-6]|uniref:Hydrogenase maturation protease n=1 Tax=Clostridium hominis TaxID=2763036 RepID=A0ABR7DGJ0_9CLOT|nr:hydrogenase maturation protease [Clostridium hominis]MBC5630557.1 hydrogenase maturation protease [Clostridium hominis]MDU2672115.1 hydrogenase maturation protease [Clostridium sp.]
MIKVFGIGNILLCDDGIGVRVAENLKEEIEALGDDIEVIIGKTDVLYCINKIEEDDEVIIIDSTYFMTRPGAVTVKSLDRCDEFINYDYSPHEESLLSLLRKERRDVKGYLIGIEISHIDYSEELSKILNRKFKDICTRVYNEISEIVS